MALTDIISYSSDANIMNFTRGNIGSVVDIVLSRFTEMKLPAIGGGSAVFPAVGDVDLTAAPYGPNGNDYTGTLKQPATLDVKLGVQYGAGSTEFTGTLVGGSETSYIF